MGNVAAIPWLAETLFAVIATIVGFVTTNVTNRVLKIGAFITAIGLLVAAFMGAAYALVDALSYVAPPYVNEGVSLFLPSNYAVCFGVVASTRLLCWVHHWNIVVMRKAYE